MNVLSVTLTESPKKHTLQMLSAIKWPFILVPVIIPIGCVQTVPLVLASTVFPGI